METNPSNGKSNFLVVVKNCGKVEMANMSCSFDMK